LQRWLAVEAIEVGMLETESAYLGTYTSTYIGTYTTEDMCRTHIRHRHPTEAPLGIDHVPRQLEIRV
jgi:hypothetical protein